MALGYRESQGPRDSQATFQDNPAKRTGQNSLRADQTRRVNPHHLLKWPHSVPPSQTTTGISLRIL